MFDDLTQNINDEYECDVCGEECTGAEIRAFDGAFICVECIMEMRPDELCELCGSSNISSALETLGISREKYERFRARCDTGAGYGEWI